MADGILTPCNVACGSGIVTVNSPSGSTLQCDTWLGIWHAIEFARWQYPAMWHVAVESWHWIHQLAAPCSVAGGSGITYHWIRLNVRHIGILHLVSISTTSSQSTCHLHQFPKFYPNRTTLGRKKWRHVDFQDGGFQPSRIVGVQ